MIAQAAPIARFSIPASRLNSVNTATFECLRGMDVFSHWPDGDLLKLTSGARERRADTGEIILRQDDCQAKHLYVLLAGEATVTWENSGGQESLLATLRSGEIVGEMELFDEGPRSATVRATTQTRWLMLQREDLLSAMRARPESVLGFLTHIARRLRQSNRRLVGICNQRTPHRVAAILVALLDERGTRLKDSEGRRCLLLRQRPTQKRIAEMAGTTRETVSRLFAQWEKAGWLEDRNNDLMVLDEARLRRLAGEA